MILSILAFLITILIIVIVHEFGHYIFARLFKVKISVFSVGFGPKLFSFKGKYNEWRLSMIPFGGYVKMLDEREGPVAKEDQPFAYNNKKPYQKIIIALAGPIFNLLFAVVVYYFLAISGVPELKPIIASINSEVAILNNVSFEPGTKINTINNKPVTSWESADRTFNHMAKHYELINLNITTPNQQIKNIPINIKQSRKHFNQGLYLETLGLYPASYLPIISYVEPKSPAMRSGLLAGDQIVAINNIKMNNWFNIAGYIKQAADQVVTIDVLRNHQTIRIKVRPEITDNDGHVTAKIGIMPTLNDKELQQNSIIKKYSYIGAFGYAINACYSVIGLNLSSLYDMFSGNGALSNLGGPIMVAKVGGKAFSLGIKEFVNFLALISIGLALINLLPIPVLDGGHVLIYLVEWIIGKEVSYSLQNIIFMLGIILVVGISFIALYNDLLRL